MYSLRQYGVVRVRQLLQSPDAYNGWNVNQRPPQVGDVGTVVDIFPGMDGKPDCYVVESSGADGVTVWLGDFSAAELEPIE
jgi:hypothetical protein